MQNMLEAGEKKTSQLAGEKPGDIAKQPGVEGQDVLLGYLLFFQAAHYPPAHSSSQTKFKLTR